MRTRLPLIAAVACVGLIALLRPGAPASAADADDVILRAAPVGGLALGARETRAPLLRRDGAPPRREDLQARGRLYLVVRNLSARAPPGAVFRVYLGLRPGETPRANDPRYVGSLSFYDAVRGPGGGWTANVASFEITRLLARAGRRAALDPAVTIVASRPPRAGSDPRVGEILVAKG